MGELNIRAALNQVTQGVTHTLGGLGDKIEQLGKKSEGWFRSVSTTFSEKVAEPAKKIAASLNPFTKLDQLAKEMALEEYNQTHAANRPLSVSEPRNVTHGNFYVKDGTRVGSEKSPIHATRLSTPPSTEIEKRAAQVDIQGRRQLQESTTRFVEMPPINYDLEKDLAQVAQHKANEAELTKEMDELTQQLEDMAREVAELRNLPEPTHLGSPPLPPTEEERFARDPDELLMAPMEEPEERFARDPDELLMAPMEEPGLPPPPPSRPSSEEIAKARTRSTENLPPPPPPPQVRGR